MIVLHIKKQNSFIRLSYEKQKYEKTLALLQTKKQELTCSIACLQNETSIKKYAELNLGMQPLSLHKIKRIPRNG